MTSTDSATADTFGTGDGEALSGRAKQKRRKMKLEELAGILEGEIQSAKEADRTTYQKDRQRSLEYYLGDMPDTKAPPNRSKAMSRDVADTVDWMLPALMRVFFSGDKIVDYLPTQPGDEQFAAQATEYVNFVFNNRCDGYGVLWDAFWDALVMRVGIVKFYWDETPQYSTESYTGLSDDALAAVMTGDIEGDVPEIEVIEQETTEVLDEMTGGFVALHDIKLKRLRRKGDIKIESVPPEEFLINIDATSIEDARFLCHRPTKTRSQLIKEGYPKEKVDKLPSSGDADTEDEAIVRADEFVHGPGTSAETADHSMEDIQVYECFAMVDMDGDGIAEWMRVVLAGGFSKENILAHEPWGDPIPFADLVPARIPHRWQGRSIADQTVDIQQIKTVLLRNALDNIYENANRQRTVSETMISNLDEVVSPQFGGVIRVKAGNDARAAVSWDSPPQLAPELFQMMGYLDDMIEKRTGVSRTTAALDPETLQNQTATAAQIGHDSRYSKIELVARNFAEGGLRHLFMGLLKLVVEHQDRPEMIRLRDTFVPMDPRSWNTDMDVSVNIGLGAGSRDRDMAMLHMILGFQKEILDKYGPTNPFVTIPHVWNTLDKIIQTAGLKHTDQFFQPLSQEEVQGYAQQQQAKPDPKVQADMQKAQADVQIAQMKAKSDFEIKVQELQAQIALKREEGQQRLNLEREEMQLRHQARMHEIQTEMTMKREMRAQEMEMEYALRQLQLQNADIPNTDPTNLPRNQ